MIEKNNPRISVVIPVYKVEKYLNKCLESILCQTYTNMEIILVDDGSPDRCPQLCDEYALKHSCIKVIHKQNGGLISAWSTGVQAATAEYIAFVDSDDWVSKRYLEIMVNALTRTPADIVSCSLMKVWYDKEEACKAILPPGFYGPEKLKADVYPVLLNAGDFEQRGIPMSRYGKIIRKDLIQQNLRYLDQKVTYAEDVNIIFPIFLSAKTLYLVDDPECMYYYRYNPASMLNAYDRNRHYSINHVHPTLLKICEEKKALEMVPQVYADFLAASVQYFKNELQNPGGLCAARKNISEYVYNPMLQKAICSTKYDHYRKLNVIIIGCLKNYNWWNRYVITTLLKMLKRLKMRKDVFYKNKVVA